MKLTVGILVASMCTTGAYAQYALDYPMVDVHTKAGLGVMVDQCRPDLPVIHVVSSERRGDKKVPVTSITQCVPKAGDNVLGFLCDFAKDTCQTASMPQPAKELEAALRQGVLSKGQRL